MTTPETARPLSSKDQADLLRVYAQRISELLLSPQDQLGEAGFHKGDCQEISALMASLRRTGMTRTSISMHTLSKDGSLEGARLPAGEKLK